MSDLFAYDTSWLNPALKLGIAVIYILVAYAWFRARRLYEGDLYRVLSILLWMGTLAAVAAFLRYLGHGTQFGFTKEFSLKWFQSLGYVVQAILYVVAAKWFVNGVIPVIRG